MKNNAGGFAIRGEDGALYVKKAEEVEIFKAEPKYGEGKKLAAVAVTNKKGKTFIRTQKVGVKKEEKPWWSELKQYNLTKYPVGIDKESVELNIEGDINSHWVLKWKNTKTNKTELSYTKEFLNRNAQFKWQRIQNVDNNTIEQIRGKSLSYLKNEDLSLKERDAAAIINIIASTGLRPGDKQHFKSTGNRGVATLAVENIKITGNKVSFNFTGKSHKENNAQITNKVLADYLKERISDKQPKDFVFEADRADTIVTFRLKLGFKNLKLKDMRTYVATDLARQILFEDKSSPPPLPEEKSKIKKMIQSKLTNCFEIVSQRLNNTPTMAKNSYIHPMVIDAYLTKLGVDKTILQKSIEEDNFEMSLDEIISSTKSMINDEEIQISEFDEEGVDYFNLPKWWSE
jgi:DNA topoisomerase-1